MHDVLRKNRSCSTKRAFVRANPTHSFHTFYRVCKHPSVFSDVDSHSSHTPSTGCDRFHSQLELLVSLLFYALEKGPHHFCHNSGAFVCRFSSFFFIALSPRTFGKFEKSCWLCFFCVRWHSLSSAFLDSSLAETHAATRHTTYFFFFFFFSLPAL